MHTCKRTRGLLSCTMHMFNIGRGGAAVLHKSRAVLHMHSKNKVISRPCPALPCLALPFLALPLFSYLPFSSLALPSFPCLPSLLFHCIPSLLFYAFPCTALMFSALPCIALKPSLPRPFPAPCPDSAHLHLCFSRGEVEIFIPDSEETG